MRLFFLFFWVTVSLPKACSLNTLICTTWIDFFSPPYSWATRASLWRQPLSKPAGLDLMLISFSFFFGLTKLLADANSWISYYRRSRCIAIQSELKSGVMVEKNLVIYIKVRKGHSKITLSLWILSGKTVNLSRLFDVLFFSSSFER